MQQALAILQQVSVRLGGIAILDNISLTIQPGEQWAIIGPSGSGKTTLARALAGQIFYRGEIAYGFPPSTGSGQAPSEAVLVVEQQHKFKNRFNTSDFYYQQRFNSADADNSQTVAEVLGDHPAGQPGDTDWVSLLHLRPLLDEPLLQLSNGENKRLQLALALLDNPALLVLDNPFTGLDAEGRKTLHAVIDTIHREGRHLLLITYPAELPDCITHVAILEKGRLAWSGIISEALQHLPGVHILPPPDEQMLRQLPAPSENDFVHAVKMVNVSVRYGDKTILDNISWEVKKGERWNLSGANGAGKSTLLSLISADNPQAYANEIYLFDRRRGSGESIWDIKQKTGFVSPELHVYFEQGMTCFEVVASGWFDTIGLFRRVSEEQEAAVMAWMQLLHMAPLRDKSFHQLSAGEQRMLLLARALIKNPPLLILDEPCQGLDDEQTVYFTQLINRICEVFPTTLIYVSHYQKDIPACVNQFLRLQDGRRVDS